MAHLYEIHWRSACLFSDSELNALRESYHTGQLVRDDGPPRRVVQVGVGFDEFGRLYEEFVIETLIRPR